MELIEVAPSGAVQENKVLAAQAGGRTLLLTRVGGKPHAFSNKCPHLGLSLERGKIEDGAIRCPWHGSSFDVCSGENRDWCNAVVGMPIPKWTSRLIALGKKPSPLPVYETVEEGGKVFVRLPGQGA